MKIFPFLISLFFFFPSAAQTTVSGKVLDFETKAPLAFVSISVKGSSQGTLSDIDGKFSLEVQSNAVLAFSYLGYETGELNLLSQVSLNNILVRLKAKAVTLREVKVLPGINPAERIILKASASRDRNNPEKMRSFSYTSYSKTYITSDMAAQDTGRTLDTLHLSPVKKILQRQHLFLTETVSERKYIHPGRNNEKVIASRVSGFKESPFAMLATQMQSFSFYEDLVNVMGKNYLNPLSGGSIRKYVFQLEDTLYEKGDTVYIISFHPRKNKNFDGLNGTLYINTNGYAVQNVIAEPWDNSAMLGIKIQQKYELVEGKQWFPVQLNTDWIYNNILVGDSSISASTKAVESPAGNNNKVKAVSRSYISRISLNPQLSKKQFSEVEVEMEPMSGRKEESFWKTYRVDSLTVKDIRTYQVIDSLGKKENFDRKIIAYEALASGKLRWGFVNVDLNTLINVNKYEGFRAGFGFHTNERVLKWMSVGGYGAYGFKDGHFKYGADLSFFPWRKQELALNFLYKNDVVEPASTVFLEERSGLANLESIRNFYVAWMDHVIKYEASVSFRALKYLRLSLFADHQQRWGERGFGFSENGITFVKDSFSFNEVGLRLKYTYGEKFSQTLRSKLPVPGNYPTIYFNIARGLSNTIGGIPGEFGYTRLDMKLQKNFVLKSIGKENIQLLAGKVFGNIPYTFLYNTKGSFSPDFNVSVPNTFETMGLTEFASSEYAALFFSHNIGKFLRPRKKFNPELELVHNMGWGRLEHPGSLIGFLPATLEEGYFESGLRLLLLKMSFEKLGLGAFYRYGPYQFSEPVKNIALKAYVAFSF